MGKKVLPTEGQFAGFAQALVERGFRRMSSSEVRSDFERLKTESPRRREGREAGFVFKI